MSRPKRVYVRLHHDLIDRYPDVWHDRDLRGDYMALLVEADQAWPGSFLPSRLVADDSIAKLAELGILEPRGHDRYVLPDHWHDRSERSEQAAANVNTRYGDGNTPVPTDVPTSEDRTGVHSPSQATPSQSEPAAAWKELYGKPATAGALRWLDGLIETHGPEAVTSAMRAVDNASADYLSRVQGHLERAAEKAERRERDRKARAHIDSLRSMADSSGPSAPLPPLSFDAQ